MTDELLQPENYTPLSVQQRTDWNNNAPPELAPHAQYEISQFKNGNSFGNLTPEQLSYAKQGLPDSYLSGNSMKYPEFKKGSIDFGTDMERYLGMPTTVPPTTTPGTTPPTVHPTADQLKVKYASNPYLREQGRYNWGNKLDNEFPIAGGKVRDAVTQAAQFNKIDPALLYGSAMEEGMSGAVDPKYSDNASEAYVNWSEKNKEKAAEYPVDSFFNYGLDTFADQAADLEKKGYLPKGFSTKYTKFYAENEKGEKLNAAAFKTDADALLAKSAMMRQSNDQLEDYLKKNNITLTPRQKEFFLLANYNAGEGNMRKMIQSYKEKGYLKDEKFLETTFKPASYGGVYRNVQARLQAAKLLRDEKYF